MSDFAIAQAALRAHGHPVAAGGGRDLRLEIIQGSRDVRQNGKRRCVVGITSHRCHDVATGLKEDHDRVIDDCEQHSQLSWLVCFHSYFFFVLLTDLPCQSLTRSDWGVSVS
jgi:hypothetical protein